MNTNLISQDGSFQSGASSERWTWFVPYVKWPATVVYTFIAVCAAFRGVPGIRIQSGTETAPAVVLTILGSRVPVTAEPPRFCFIANGGFHPHRWLTASEVQEGGAQ